MKTKIKFYSDEATDFHNKEMPKAGSNHAYLAVIKIDFALKKMKTIICKCFWKNANALKKKWLGILMKTKKIFWWFSWI